MSKRFTATEKWDKAWFCKLSSKLKCLWFYILDRCDSAGVWDINFELASFCIGEQITENDMLNFSDRVEKISTDKYFISSFIRFQYGELSTSCKPHLSILEKLKRVSKEYPKGINTLKDKDKDKDKDKERGDARGENKKNLSEDEKEIVLKDKKFEEFWELYPRRDGKKVGKAEAKKYFIAKIKDEEFLLMLQAVRNYASSKGCRDGYAKDAIRFLRQDFWKDWIEKEKGGDIDEAGSGDGGKIKGQIDYSKYQTA